VRFIYVVSTRGGPKLALLPGSLILIYQRLEEENLDQKLPGPPGWELMQQASSSLIIQKTRNAKKPNTNPQMLCNSRDKYNSFHTRRRILEHNF